MTSPIAAARAKREGAMSDARFERMQRRDRQAAAKAKPAPAFSQPTRGAYISPGTPPYRPILPHGCGLCGEMGHGWRTCKAKP